MSIEKTYFFLLNQVWLDPERLLRTKYSDLIYSVTKKVWIRTKINLILIPRWQQCVKRIYFLWYFLFLGLLSSTLQYVYCIPGPGSFNTNISHKIFDYKITFVNSQLENTNSKGDFIFKIQLKHSF